MDYPSDDEVIAISYLQEIEAKLKIKIKNEKFLIMILQINWITISKYILF